MCGNATQKPASADAALAAWTTARFPAEQLVLGVPSYGYLSRTDADTLQSRRGRRRLDRSRRRLLDADPDAPVVLTADGGTDGGQIQFRDLVQQGALQRAPGADGAFAGAGGFVRGWDVCSGTPFVHSGAARQVVAFDDPGSLALKAAFVRAAGMRGVNLFDVHGDTDEWALTDALRSGLGLPAV